MKVVVVKRHLKRVEGKVFTAASVVDDEGATGWVGIEWIVYRTVARS